MDDHPSRHCVLLNPLLLRLLAFQEPDCRLVPTRVIESLLLNHIEAGDVVLPAFGLVVGVNSRRSFGHFVEECFDFGIGNILLDGRDDHCPEILEVLHGGIDVIVSELGLIVLKVLIGILDFLEAAEGNIGPSPSIAEHSHIASQNLGLLLLILDESLQLFRNLSRVLVMLGINVLNVQDIGPVLVGVLVDLSLDVLGDLGVGVDLVHNEGKHNLVIFLSAVDGRDGLHFDNLAGFLDVADVEEATGIVEGLLGIHFRLGDNDLVHFHIVGEDGADQLRDFRLEGLLVEEALLDLVDLFFRLSFRLELEHHFGKVFGVDGLGHSNFVGQDYGVVQFLLHVGSIIGALVVDEGEPFILSVFGQRQFHSCNRLDLEMLLQHFGGQGGLKPTHIDSSGELAGFLGSLGWVHEGSGVIELGGAKGSGWDHLRVESLAHDGREGGSALDGGVNRAGDVHVLACLYLLNTKYYAIRVSARI